MMSNEQCFELVAFYKSILKMRGYMAKRVDSLDRRPDPDMSYQHALYMLNRMEEFIKEGKREKFFRWLGFVQGILWLLGDLTVEDLRNHNRSDAI